METTDAAGVVTPTAGLLLFPLGEERIGGDPGTCPKIITNNMKSKFLKNSPKKPLSNFAYPYNESNRQLMPS